MKGTAESGELVRHQQRVAIRGRARDVLSGQRSIRARTIFDDDAFMERSAQRLGNDAADRIACTARSEHGDKCDRLARIVVGVECWTDKSGAGGHENVKQIFHAVPPRLSLVMTCGASNSQQRAPCRAREAMGPCTSKR